MRVGKVGEERRPRSVFPRPHGGRRSGYHLTCRSRACYSHAMTTTQDECCEAPEVFVTNSGRSTVCDHCGHRGSTGFTPSVSIEANQWR